jgi:hypothetical protein
VWQSLSAHRQDVELIAACWLAVQFAAGMPTPRESSSIAYKWAFNVAHSLINLPRLLATAFPEVTWIAAVFGLPAPPPRDSSAQQGLNEVTEKSQTQITGGGSAQ